jgi:hypothetical protein
MVLRCSWLNLEAMATRKLNLQLDEELVRRVRQQAVGAVGKSDAEVVEDALDAYLGDRVLDPASVFDPDRADA